MDEIFKKIGSWAFLLGIVIAVVVGVIFGAGLWNDPNNYVTLLLALLGFIVGVLTFFALGNIAPEKVPTFLIAALLLVGIGAALQQDFFVNLKYIGPYFTNIAAMLAVFIAPAAGLLAIRAIWDAGKSEEIEKVLPKIK